jgi:serine/threonine protein kinase
LSGLNYLHQEGFTHGDLKAKNCLLHGSGKELRIMLTNFGISQSPHITRELDEGTRSISYRAPETLIEGSYEHRSPEADIFSLGMTVFFLCFSDLPYQYADVQDEGREDFEYLREEILRWGGLPWMSRVRPELPDRLYKYLQAMVITEPSFRPTATDMLRSMQTGDDLLYFGRNEKYPLLLNTEYWQSYKCKGLR